MARPRNKSKRGNVTLQGDFGPQTAAQMKGATIKVTIGSNPNNTAQKRRENSLDRMHNLDKSITTRQYLAGNEIQIAWCKVEMLSSGGELKEQVDSSPDHGRTAASQVDIQSRLNYSMQPIPPQARAIVEHVCWYNKPIRDFPKSERAGHKKTLKAALDLVADRLRF